MISVLTMPSFVQLLAAALETLSRGLQGRRHGAEVGRQFLRFSAVRQRPARFEQARSLGETSAMVSGVFGA